MTTSLATRPAIDDESKYHAKMTALCNSFHQLRGRPGTDPWDQIAFAKWASGPAPSGAVRQAAAFVLSVWNNGTPADGGGWWNEGSFRVGRFDPVEALMLWDELHAAAFLDWCANPFWP